MVTLNLTDQEAEHIIKLLLSDKVDNVASGTGDNAPRPRTLAKSVAYLGEVSFENLFSGLELASRIGLYSGTPFNSNAGWLKFWDHGKIKYIAKKPFRHSISWDDIHAVGAVYGVKTMKGSDNFEVRLPTGGVSSKDKNNEWDRLMNLVAEQFADDELGFNSQVGWCSWTQTVPDGYPSNRVRRGGDRLALWNRSMLSNCGPVYAWRPLIELR